MTFNNETICHLYKNQLESLTWLERLEDNQQTFCFPSSADTPLPATVESTLTAVQRTLESLEASMAFEETQLFPMIKAAGEGSLLVSLEQRRQKILALTSNLYITIATIRSSPREREQAWDKAAGLVPRLSNQLIHYLFVAEKDYLTMADYLLGPASSSESWAGTCEFTVGTGELSHDLESTYLYQVQS
ncbi:hypothetical protein [Motiliproteus sp. MSK22-1]|uniref:hypothetical protein n=1 Tax=Motiliproteus sp. MSK22-1 TaxID=1897630 RepID=UPI0009771514|nr:hypothetical protein [Motiliproteus sp. MSK22-1]OMH37955.1 hypothetical protein BGP75_06605 [Motiliproteus sp. MSK22-1]